jgi:hypothetical protein
MGGTAGWLKNQAYRRQQEQAKTSELEGLQLQLLKAEVANVQKEGGDAELSKQSGQMASDYLKQWNEGLDKAGGLYNTAIAEIGKAQEMVGGAYKDVSTNLGSMSEDIKGEWENMKTQWGGIKGDLVGSAKQDIENRGQLTRQFMDLTRGDEEGAAGRAMTDVGAQGEAGRQAEAIRLQGLGIDPTSGRARSLMRTSRNQEGLGKVMAANQARLSEKDRVAGLTAQGMQLIDPTRSVNAAAGIQNMENQLLSQRSNLEVNRANVQGNLAGTTANLASQAGNIATGYAQNIAAPRGEMGATQLGVSQGSRPTAGTSTAPFSRVNNLQGARDFGARLRQQHYAA